MLSPKWLIGMTRLLPHLWDHYRIGSRTVKVGVEKSVFQTQQQSSHVNLQQL